MNRQKKIMLLGGIHYLLPVIKAAHEQGYYVITADYLPDNIAHKYSDEYVNVSIVDKEAVLKVAHEKQIDGILSFGVDPGVVAAAYVQEKMGLPSMGPYESVVILQNKDLFRAFLQEHGFNCPKSKGYSSVDEALVDTDWLTWPMIVKPTDSAGSKGVTRVDSINEYEAAVKYAFEKSIKGHIIVEQYLEKIGCSSDSDMFSVNGELRVVTYNAQRFDEKAVNPYVPAAFTWPSTYTEEQESYLTNEISRLLHLLRMGTTLYNVETRISTDGKPYIMEVSPRGGGNRLAESIRYATGVDMITAAVRAAVGDEIELYLPSVTVGKKVKYKYYFAYVVLHAPQSGIFKGLNIDLNFWKKHHVEPMDLWVKFGEYVESFTGANATIGTFPCRFDNKEEMEYVITHQSEWLKINVQ